MTIKQPWEQDLEQDDSDPRIQAIIDCLFVLAIAMACVGVLSFFLGLLWPHIEGWL